MGIADQLREDARLLDINMKRARCIACKALALLKPGQRTEMEVLMPDRSFRDTSIARWLTEHTGLDVSATSVGNHRKLHL